MSFNAKLQEAYTAVVGNEPFYPNLDVPTLQRVGKFDSRLPEQTFIDYLQEAMIQVNSDLLAWQKMQLLDGFTRLADVPSQSLQLLSHKTIQYRSAVYNLAVGHILDDFPEYAMSDQKQFSGMSGAVLAEQKQGLAQVFYRNSQAAVRKIKGESDTFVRLV